jgi:hypothetical protein
MSLACALWWEHWDAGYLIRPLLEESLALWQKMQKK